jgi:hypothetical protein
MRNNKHTQQSGSMHKLSYASAFFAILLTITTFLSSNTLAQPIPQDRGQHGNQHDRQSIDFQLNQPNQMLNLSQSEFETIFRTDQVPSTCYRSEVQGSRNECTTQYRRECRTVSFPNCTNVPRRVCRTQQVCSTTMDRVCNSRGCTNVPRRSCRNVQSCSTQHDRVCRTDTRNECQNVPYQSCRQVPVIVQVPYACTRSVQVPVGQQLKLRTQAQVIVNFVNFSEVGQTADVLKATLLNGQVNLSMINGSASSFVYHLIGTQRSEQMISATEKLVKVNLSIQAISIAKIQEFLNLRLVSGSIFTDRLELMMGGSLNVPFKGQLKVMKSSGRRSVITMIDKAIDSRSILQQRDHQRNSHKILFSSIGASQLDYGYYYVQMGLKIDLQAMQGLVNPEAIAALGLDHKQVQIQFEGNLQ